MADPMPTSPEGVIVTRTPLRVSFAGGGTDLPAFYERSHGAVLSTAIDKYVYVTVKRHGDVFDERIRLNYSTSESVSSVDAIRNDITRECIRFMEIDDRIYVSVVSDLPDSSGLGGSSSFAVGLLHALHTYRGERVSAGQLAEEAAHVELDMLREPIGKQDQYAAAFGGLNLFEFRPGGSVAVHPQRVSNGQIGGLFERMLMVWTGHQRKASSVLVEQQARTGDNLAHLERIREHAYLLQAIFARDELDYAAIGQLLDETWTLKRGLASAISNDQIDAWYDRARSAGALGGKLCGAGGGGFLVFLVEPELRGRVASALENVTAVAVRYEAQGSRVLFGD